MPKRKVRGARAAGTGPPLLRHCRRRPPARGARVDAGRAGKSLARGSRRGRRPQATPARRGCPRAPEAILEERRPRREEPCWWLFIPLPSGSSLPPRAPSPTARPPPAPPGGRAIQTRKGGKAALGVGGRGNALPPKNRPRPPTFPALETRAAAAHEFLVSRAPPSPALDGCHGNGARLRLRRVCLHQLQLLLPPGAVARPGSSSARSGRALRARLPLRASCRRPGRSGRSLEAGHTGPANADVSQFCLTIWLSLGTQLRFS
ncbi:PREDICTED: translation initiation factor IF-2-like [Chinchilla lanigera]|uniref:translation initiation factor IF-2-like n=1 Tax=Chinchilla lanigera TaxID=34839 RepID=UPI000695E5BA|nr:PREDICTED: translation initiation factor IF-2-like [Chinchilla lanigera]